jgi:hypothetical protein
VGAVVPASSGEADRRAEAVGWGSGAGEGTARGTIDGGVGRRAGATGWPTEQEQAGSPSTRGAARNRSLVPFSFPYPTIATEETDTDMIIKKMSGRRAEVYWAGIYMQAHEGASGWTKALYVAFS